MVKGKVLFLKANTQKPGQFNLKSAKRDDTRTFPARNMYCGHWAIIGTIKPEPTAPTYR